MGVRRTQLRPRQEQLRISALACVYFSQPRLSKSSPLCYKIDIRTAYVYVNYFYKFDSRTTIDFVIFLYEKHSRTAINYVTDYYEILDRTAIICVELND